jgi:predicted metal-dependent phosphoesterase TrpH
MLEECKRRFDAVEAVNARVVLNWFNTKARKFASENGLPVVGGSDSHCMYEIANAYTEADIAHADELPKAIRSGKTRAYGKRTNPLIHTLSTLTKLGIMRPRGL